MNDSIPSSEEPSDAALMRRMASDDTRAFDLLLKRHQNAVFHFIRRSTQDATLAEDLAQECFLRVWRARKSYLPTAMFRTWIFTIARRLALDSAKAQPYGTIPLEEVFPPPVHSSSDDPHSLAERKELACLLDAALNRLAPEMREVILLRDREGLTYEQIAAVVGCPLGTVKSRLCAARMSLKTAAKAWLDF